MPAGHWATRPTRKPLTYVPCASCVAPSPCVVLSSSAVLPRLPMLDHIFNQHFIKLIMDVTPPPCVRVPCPLCAGDAHRPGLPARQPQHLRAGGSAPRPRRVDRGGERRRRRGGGGAVAARCGTDGKQRRALAEAPAPARGRGLALRWGWHWHCVRRRGMYCRIEGRGLGAGGVGEGHACVVSSTTPPNTGDYSSFRTLAQGKAEGRARKPTKKELEA